MPIDRPRKVSLRDKETMAEMKERAENAIHRWICNRPTFLFWRDSEYAYFTPFQFGLFLGMGRKHGKDLKSVAKALSQTNVCKFNSATVSFECDDDGDRPGFTVELTHDHEWLDLVREVFKLRGIPETPNLLSQDGQKLLKWIQKDVERADWNSCATIGRQAELSGTSWTVDRIKAHLEEIKRKEEPGLICEVDDKYFKVHIGAVELPASSFGPLNPDFQLPSDDKHGHRELESFADRVRLTVESAELPEGNRVLRLFQIQTRKDVARCIAPNEEGSLRVYNICDFLRNVRIHPGVAVGFSFQDPNPWFVDLQPRQDWDWSKIQADLLKKREEPRLEDKYGLGAEAAAFLRWIESLDEGECLRNLSPAVEDHLKTRIGLSFKEYGDNLPVYVQMLIDEINLKTEFDLKIQPWRHYGRDHTRILINRRQPDLGHIVRDIRIYAMDQGVPLSKEVVESEVATLIDEARTGGGMNHATEQ